MRRHIRHWLFAALLVSIGVVIWLSTAWRIDARSVAVSTPVHATPLPTAESRFEAPVEGAIPPAWVLSPPDALAAPPADDNSNPCQTPDPGLGGYEAWQRLSTGQLLCPLKPATDGDGNVRVVFHFHGHESVRKEWVQVTKEVVLVALDLGNSSSAYADAFNGPSRFATLLAEAQQVLTRRLGRNVVIDRFGLSAWSAGYAALRAILTSEYASRVDSVVLLDGLHASTLESVAGRSELAAFVEFAERAARNEALMFVSHSSIDPPDYISTTQATSYLMWSLGGKPQSLRDVGGLPDGLEPYRHFDSGGFHALGFRGSRKEDHCAQVLLYGYVLREYLLPHWELRALQ